MKQFSKNQLFIIITVFFLIVLPVACNTSQNNPNMMSTEKRVPLLLQKSWYYIDFSDQENPLEMHTTFHEDGTYENEIGSITEKGTWEFMDNYQRVKVTIGGQEVLYRINLLTEEKLVLVLEREGNVEVQMFFEAE